MVASKRTRYVCVVRYFIFSVCACVCVLMFCESAESDWLARINWLHAAVFALCALSSSLTIYYKLLGALLSSWFCVCACVSGLRLFGFLAHLSSQTVSLSFLSLFRPSLLLCVSLSVSVCLSFSLLLLLCFMFHVS